jgi:hypothetical protein
MLKAWSASPKEEEEDKKEETFPCRGGWRDGQGRKNNTGHFLFFKRKRKNKKKTYKDVKEKEREKT